jgi:subtilisin family serine protease
MHKSTFKIPEKASISLVSVLRRRARKIRPASAARAAGFSGEDPNSVQKGDRVSVLVEASEPDKVLESMSELGPAEELVRLNGNILSANLTVESAEQLLKLPPVQRVQSKKQSILHLTAALADVRVRPVGGGNRVTETGKGVLIGVVDSGFDLSHPMFRDANNNLRVEGLLDQTGGNKEFTTAELEAAWANGAGPGADPNGHGTHVASIAGGSPFNGWEGIAPDARFLLVRTDFLNTDKAVKWIFNKAGAKPCVVNFSLGHHWGAHDGTDVEERLHRSLTGPGKIIVVSAGNEREDHIHLGGRFSPLQGETVSFDVLRQRDGSAPFAAITLWYHKDDVFDVSLVTPTGQQLDVPALGSTDNYQSATLDLELGRKPYSWSNLIQVQIVLSFSNPAVTNQVLRNWGLKLTARTVVVGRIDLWVHNSGFAEFHDHPLVERNRTVGLTATGEGCLAVASHVSKNAWDSDAGPEQDLLAVSGRSSPFSSQGPTRDGRWKPEISAPGQYVTAALADQSELAGIDQRALVDQRLLTIEGTSMAAPVVTGVVALLLQKKKTLTLDKVRELLRDSARHDDHTGPEPWNPAYGYGKIDVQAALANI